MVDSGQRDDRRRLAVAEGGRRVTGVSAAAAGTSRIDASGTAPEGQVTGYEVE